MKLHIKNMVSNRCIKAIKDLLEKIDIHYSNVELGEVELLDEITLDQYELLRIELNNIGFELIVDTRTVLAEKIKNEVIEMVYYSEEKYKLKFSNYLSNKLKHSYNYMANVFSQEFGIPMSHFILLCRTERIKEFLIYGELSISEIAWKMNYSSVAHLSNQFKKVTGISPYHFKQIKVRVRYPIEEFLKRPNDFVANKNCITTRNLKEILTKDYALTRYQLLAPEALCLSS